MTVKLSRTLGGDQRSSACNRTSKDTHKKRQQLQRRRNMEPCSTQTQTISPHYTLPTANFTARKRASKPPPSSSSRPRVCRSLPSRLSSSDNAPAAPITPMALIAPADPEFIAQLWQDVMSSANETWQGVMSYAMETESSTSKREQTTIPLSETDPDFETQVLTPYGISLVESREPITSYFEHFSFPPDVPRDLRARFKRCEKEFPLPIWLQPTMQLLESISKEYALMNEEECLEAEFQAFALETIFFRVPRETLHTPDITLKPVRVLQCVPEQASNTSTEPLLRSFLTPPRIDLSGKQYEWEIHLDCAYYVSLEAFDVSYRVAVSNLYPTIYNRGVCSYLSIKFRKNDQELPTAKNQVAIASAVALYNRWCTKREMLKLENKHSDWSTEDKDELRHYCVILAGSTWSIWCTTPKTYENWSGCTMSQISVGDCCEALNLGLFFSILNDIHLWGLTTHGKSCVADINAIAKRKSSHKRITGDPEAILHWVKVNEDVNRGPKEGSG
ncbi:hypothetical protein F4860DRAFT_528281 [Xylaria cubensis]|nr:hypothetical protein F4860DRAFT_528281 [Xylaria cubensis]